MIGFRILLRVRRVEATVGAAQRDIRMGEAGGGGSPGVFVLGVGPALYGRGRRQLPLRQASGQGWGGMGRVEGAYGEEQEGSHGDGSGKRGWGL